MRMRWEVSTGTPDDVREQLRRAVSAYVRTAAGFKIGRTDNPERRSAARDYSRYDEMVVIYETQSAANADEVEADLVDFFEAESDNQVGGGGGPLGEPPYYVYVVVEW